MKGLLPMISLNKALSNPCFLALLKSVHLHLWAPQMKAQASLENNLTSRNRASSLPQWNFASVRRANTTSSESDIQRERETEIHWPLGGSKFQWLGWYFSCHTNLTVMSHAMSALSCPFKRNSAHDSCPFKMENFVESKRNVQNAMQAFRVTSKRWLWHGRVFTGTIIVKTGDKSISI